MKVNQVYSVINNIAKNMKLGTSEVVDYTTFVSFGNDVLNSTNNKEVFYQSLLDRIGKTIIAIREYTADTRHTIVDEFTFGNILQKISYKYQDAESNSSWEKTPSNPYTWKSKNDVVQNLFAQALPTFCFTDVIYDKQLESAFISPVNMSAFINGLYIRMRNSYEISKEGMVNATINGLIDKVHGETTAEPPINTRRCRNLLAEYNATHEPITSVVLALENKNFLEFCCVEMGIIPSFIKKPTLRYNNGTVERHTSNENLIVEIATEFNKKYDVYLKSNTFHDTLVNLPNYSDIPYWNNPENPMTVYDNLGNVSLENVICIMRDVDACACTLEREKFVSKYDEINERTYIKLSADRRFIADTSENVVVFYLKYNQA